MPCRDYESDDYASRIQTGTAMLLKRQADRLARIACTAMKAYEAGQDFESLIEDPEISAWTPDPAGCGRGATVPPVPCIGL